MDLQEFEKITAGVGNLTQTNGSYQSPPEPTLPTVHPLIELKHAVTENKRAQTNLMVKKIFLKKNYISMLNSYARIEDGKETIKELFIASDNGVKENKASRARFDEIINQEKIAIGMLKKEKISAQIKIEEYKKVEKDLRNYVGIYSVYENFLENVAQAGDNWRSVSDILSRYETLQKTGMACATLLGDELRELMNLRKQIVAIVEEKSEKLKSLNNRLVFLQVRSKEARDRREHWEHMMGKIKNAILDTTQESLSLSGGMYDLYRTMCRRLSIVARLPEEDVETQLDFIHKTILFYKEVVIIATSSKTTQPVKQVVVKRRRSQKKKNK